jgi:signal peptidase II
MDTPRSHRLRNWVLLAAGALCLLALDQVTKWLVVRNLAVNEAWVPIPALSKIFTITHVQNTGVAFGQLGGLGWVFMLVNLTVFVGVLVCYPRIPAGQWPLRLAATLILAGDLGNVIDRVRTTANIAQVTGKLWTALPKAYVTDMFAFRFWWVFNVADLCVVTGVALLAWMLWRTEGAQTGREAASREAENHVPVAEGHGSE